MNKSYQLIALGVSLLSLSWIVHALRVRFRPGLRKLPGPKLAAYSRLWNVKTAASGDAHEIFRRLHKRYGNVVRTGPNHVAIADPALISIIYGTNNKYLKVSLERRMRNSCNTIVQTFWNLSNIDVD